MCVGVGILSLKEGRRKSDVTLTRGAFTFNRSCQLTCGLERVYGARYYHHCSRQADGLGKAFWWSKIVYYYVSLCGYL